MNKPGKAPAKSQQSAKGSKQAILDAALQAFARNGYDGASIPGIARIAGVAPPLIHYYFESKENLWRGAVDHSLGELRIEAAAVLRATRALGPLDRLRTLLQVHAEFAARCPDHFSMIVAEARADSDRFAWLQENYTGVLFEEVVAVLDEAAAAGLIREVSRTNLATILIGSILVNFTFHPSQVEQPSDAAATSNFVELLFDLLTRGVMA